MFNGKIPLLMAMFNIYVKLPEGKSVKWGWVKTLVPSEPQNSWYMDVHPTKNGINRY
jgi:hypothetical protein